MRDLLRSLRSELVFRSGSNLHAMTAAAACTSQHSHQGARRAAGGIRTSCKARGSCVPIVLCASAAQRVRIAQTAPWPHFARRIAMVRELLRTVLTRQDTEEKK